VSTRLDVPAVERLDRDALAAAQGRRLKELLRHVHGRNAFYTRKLDAAGIRVDALDLPNDLARLPLTTKAELVADQRAHRPWGSALTEPLGRYTRYCQTSSTTGHPMRWLDTPESWQWMLECWKTVFRAARVGADDRIFFPFSFGPFLGFWTAFDAASQIGAMCIPGGGMSSHLRLATIETTAATVICCTPTYALRLAEVAAQEIAEGTRSTPLAANDVRVLIVAGEPGGSVPATRAQIEQSWGARVIDHHGLTEVGPVSFECWERPGGMHLNEAEFLCEVLDPITGAEPAEGQPGELVITNLGRLASPVIRYRTGDLVVRRLDPCVCGRTWAWLERGILSRADDMVTVRGVNVYPAAIEAVVREFAEVAEFRSTVSKRSSLRELSLEIEPLPEVVDRKALTEHVAQRLREALGLTVPVRAVESGALPRFEMKARRLVVDA
jgi:phenylacetate-CoA ligase